MHNVKPFLNPFWALMYCFSPLSLVKFYLTLHHGRREQVLCCEHGYEWRLSLGERCDWERRNCDDWKSSTLSIKKNVIKKKEKKQRQSNEKGARNEIVRLSCEKIMADCIVCIWGVRIFMNVYAYNCSPLPRWFDSMKTIILCSQAKFQA